MAVKYMLCSKKKKQGMLKLMKEREKKINMPTIMKIFGEGGGGLNNQTHLVHIVRLLIFSAFS